MHVCICIHNVYIYIWVGSIPFGAVYVFLSKVKAFMDPSTLFSLSFGRGKRLNTDQRRGQMHSAHLPYASPRGIDTAKWILQLQSSDSHFYTLVNSWWSSRLGCTFLLPRIPGMKCMFFIASINDVYVQEQFCCDSMRVECRCSEHSESYDLLFTGSRTWNLVKADL